MTTSDLEESARKKERFDSFLKILIPALVTLALGIATFWIDQRISQRAEREQSSRLYTQLISQREQASSDLRKDMFATILSGFLNSKKGESDIPSSSKILDEDLLKLELLALNFGEALSLGPIFAMMDRRINTADSYSSDVDELLHKKGLHGRLVSLARRVGDTQRGSLEARAKSISIDVPLDRMGEVRSYVWPANSRDERLSCLVLDGIQRRITLAFLKPDEINETIDIKLKIFTNRLSPESSEECHESFNQCAVLPTECVEHLVTDENPIDTDPFTIDQFNLPLIDNSLLSDDQRFALMMRSFKAKKIEVVAILFPGAFAGRRDKLTLDEAIEELKRRLE